MYDVWITSLTFYYLIKLWSTFFKCPAVILSSSQLKNVPSSYISTIQEKKRIHEKKYESTTFLNEIKNWIDPNYKNGTIK